MKSSGSDGYEAKPLESDQTVQKRITNMTP